jgi:hypothetical protein
VVRVRVGALYIWRIDRLQRPPKSFKYKNVK